MKNLFDFIFKKRFFSKGGLFERDKLILETNFYFLINKKTNPIKHNKIIQKIIFNFTSHIISITSTKLTSFLLFYIIIFPI